MDHKVLDDLLTALFLRLRAAGVPLGLPELLDARRALTGRMRAGDDPRLKRVLRLLWCTCAADSAELEAQLDRLLAERPANAEGADRNETPPGAGAAHTAARAHRAAPGTGLDAAAGPGT
jgi:uncharacterized protein with von Willebrand factor type A (vWA) domain